jgi:protein-disulfide isomerase
MLISAVAALAAPALAAPLPDDMSLGNPKAPVTVIEYASVGCPHCATWSREVFPAFKKRFIDTGRVRFVLREMLTGDPDVAAAGFLTARCAGATHYFQVVEGLFAAAPQMAADNDDMPSLLKVAGEAGLSKTQVADCLSNHAALADLEKRVDAHVNADHADSTPTFDINGKRLEGEQSLMTLAEAIDAAGRRRR